MATSESAAVVVANLLNGYAGLTLGTNLFASAPRPALDSNLIPRSCVFCYSFLNFTPMPYLGTGQTFRDRRVNILIRWQQDAFAAGELVARNVWEALQQRDPSAYTGYFGCLMAEADPIYIGLDDTDCHRWETIARLLYKGA